MTNVADLVKLSAAEMGAAIKKGGFQPRTGRRAS